MGADPAEVIIISTVIITTSTAIRHVKEQTFTFSTFVFGFLLTIALLIIAVPAPGFAKALAYLGMIGAFATNGPAVFGLVNQIGGTGAGNGRVPPGPVRTV